MKRESNKVLTTSVAKLLRRNATAQLQKIISRTHPADLAYTFSSLTPEQRQSFFRVIEHTDRERAAEVLSELEPGILVRFLEEVEDRKLVDILEVMPPDDTADTLDLVRDEERRDKIVAMMRTESQAETESLLAFDPESAGGLMSTDYFALEQNTTAQEALEQLQKEAGEAEVVFYLYVVSEHDTLVGVASLRELVRAERNRPLKEFMIPDVIRVRVDTDQEEVARLIARYNLVALPVVDDNNRLVGIVTVDDIIDVIRSEATEDMLLMAGAGQEDVSRYNSVLFSFRTRWPWLFPSFLGGILAMLVVFDYSHALREMIPLAAFIPVMIGMAGNIGTQSSAIVTRGLSLGKYDFVELGRVVLKELVVGTLLGVSYGVLVAAIAGTLFWQQDTYDSASPLIFAGTIAASLLAAMSVAATLGSVVPILFKKMNLDPATASGPLVITAIDVLGVWIFLAIAVLMLGL
ncbi:magnesium transporter [Persicimonas caeni]|uniref:Magnesium transporter MgtE n=1 Tax=Persicimonas caeni TaxID=2292766 RepID=A0A4Y6PQC0_PERCE|nr:magnesium transporter [Persicimonas caeni]QDG49965.1 magnesium transporter [Persicimonas caeni]QED31186.1 magnesium transporter [Persicimonas caeni]